MSAFDFNDAPSQQNFDLIPDKTMAVVQMRIEEGGAGKDGLLTRSSNGQAELLKCELVIVEGKYANRKLWANMVVSGTTEGHEQAADITRGRLRAILESARGIKPTDLSEAAKKARQITGYADFNGIRFWALIGIEPAKGDYRAKNILLSAITPDQKGWSAVQQVEQPLMHAVPADPKAVIIPRPAWGQP
jgi:hypothetical protein